MQTYDEIEAEVRKLAHSLSTSDFGSTLAIQAVAQHVMQKIEAERTKVSNLRFALANIVDRDLTIVGHFVAGNEITHAHIFGARRALRENN